MTTIIAIRQGKKIILACDSQATGGGTPYTVNKIYKVKGYTFAAAGSLAGAQKTAESLRKSKSKKPPSAKQFAKHVEDGTQYILAFKKHLYSVGWDGSIVEMGDGEPVGIGSGSDFAIGALCHGASPAEAIETAAAFDVYTGGQIIELVIK